MVKVSDPFVFERSNKGFFSLEATNFVPSDLEMGIGFHLEQAEDEVYPLPPRGTAVIPLSVLSSMWGHYKDTLQLEVTVLIPVRSLMSSLCRRSKALKQSKRFPFECKSLGIRSKRISMPIQTTKQRRYLLFNSVRCCTIQFRW